MRSWEDPARNGGREYRLWTQNELGAIQHGYPDLIEAADRRYRANFRNRYRWLSDIWRHHLLWVFGGIYVDIDIELRQEIKPGHFDKKPLTLAMPGPAGYAPGLIGARAPEHPFFDNLLERYAAVDAMLHKGSVWVVPPKVMAVAPFRQLIDDRKDEKMVLTRPVASFAVDAKPCCTVYWGHSWKPEAA